MYARAKGELLILNIAARGHVALAERLSCQNCDLRCPGIERCTLGLVTSPIRMGSIQIVHPSLEYQPLFFNGDSHTMRLQPA